MPEPLPQDLQHVLKHAGPAFLALRDARIFITGGTGFFGHSLLESLLYANRELNLNLHATALTRSAEGFRRKAPHIANNDAITLLEGDVRSFAFPSESHTHILHAATDSTGAQADTPPSALAESILDGTRHVLHFAKATGATRLLYVSTGAVYGRSTELPHTPESYPGAPDPTQLASAYDEAKRMAETLCITHAHGTPLEPVLARCFAFIGPHLPLDAHFAMGNFLGAALRGTPIHIKGDGTPRRSWMHTADLAVWLWTMLAHGRAKTAYNVGSDEGYTITEAAKLTAATLASELPIQIDGTPDPNAPLNSYVPDITRAREQLGLNIHIGLPTALRRTAAWHRS